METIDYCQQIEQYLCRKNDGHLIRVVGPSFEIVSRWAADGVPLKVACRGIDRYFERYYGKGPRRRPVKVDFCEADVLDVFDEWRRALGLPTGAPAGAEPVDRPVERSPAGQSHSLPAHLERAVIRLSNARAGGAITAAFDPIIDRVAAELDAARAHAGGIRGEARQALIDRLEALDRQLADAGRRELDAAALADCAREADDELRTFRATMAPESFARARDVAIDRLVRERLGLPVVTYL